MTSTQCSALSILAELGVVWLAICAAASGQVTGQDLEMEVQGLPSLMARSQNRSDVLLTSLDTIFHNREVCCGKDSALEDSVQAADPKSLKDVAAKLQGRHLLSDGRPIMVTADFLTAEQMNAGHLITMMQNQHAPLMQWNSHIYVLHGLVYFWIDSGNSDVGSVPVSMIHKLLLWDTRYSDSRREVVFNRETDDPSTIQGFLFVDSKLQ
jgi:hypothetical protein